MPSIQSISLVIQTQEESCSSEPFSPLVPSSSCRRKQSLEAAEKEAQALQARAYAPRPWRDNLSFLKDEVRKLQDRKQDTQLAGTIIRAIMLLTVLGWLAVLPAIVSHGQGMSDEACC